VDECEEGEHDYETDGLPWLGAHGLWVRSKICRFCGDYWEDDTDG
jgi:hypothetical protein